MKQVRMRWPNWANRLRHITTWTVLYIGLAFCAASPAFASGGIHVTPARMEAIIGEDGVAPPLTVHNRMDRPVRIHVSVGWGTHDAYGIPIYFDEPFDAHAEAHVHPSELLLLPGARAEIRLQVTPADRPHYPVVFLAWHAGQTRSAAGTEFQAVTRIAVPVLLTPANHPPGHVRIIDIGAEAKEPHAVEIHVMVENAGDAHVKTSGEALVLDQTGNVVGLLRLPELLVLPGAKRLLRMTWQPEEAAAGPYTLFFNGLSEATTPPFAFSL